jgi:hypothetical protein
MLNGASINYLKDRPLERLEMKEEKEIMIDKKQSYQEDAW